MKIVLVVFALVAPSVISWRLHQKWEERQGSFTGISSVGLEEGEARLNECPVCGNSSVFEPYGYPPRAAAKCKTCGALKRHRLLYLYLKHRTPLFEEALSLLHFAPNPGLERVFRSLANLRYVTADLYEKADLKLDITGIDLPDESYDVILCYHVLEHVTEDRKAMRELYRVLKPGGWAVVQVPVSDDPDTYEDPDIVDPAERLKHFGQTDHVRLYGWRDFEDRLRAAGFQLTVHGYAATLDADTIERYSLDPDEKIYHCRKPKPGEAPVKRPPAGEPDAGSNAPPDAAPADSAK
jgi:predicted SAM-dependent methyltransferase